MTSVFKGSIEIYDIFYSNYHQGAKLMKPLIAISSSYDPTHSQHGYETMGPHFYIYADYVRPIVELGGAPVIIPVLRDTDYYRDSMLNASGLLLIGGIDVNPFLFGHKVEKGCGKVDPDKDFGEIEMFKIALEMDIPILAICRGIQLMNLAKGGTLHQDIADDIPEAFKHNPGFPPGTFCHHVNVETDSLLYSIVKTKRFAVDSSHHQAVDKIGDGCAISARSDDGVIEALEIQSKRWVIGVQWHPERVWRYGIEHKMLFESFVKACGR